MKRADHLARGRWAEDYAQRHMEGRGLRLLARNYRCKMGELDLILEDGNTLVVAEVRYRRRSDYGTPAETVDEAKQRKLIRATLHFLSSKPDLGRLPVRFDVVAISGDTEPEVDWIKDAFQT